MAIDCGIAFAFTGSSFTSQRPSLPAVPDFTCPANVTVTFVPGVSQPQMGFVCFCWSTMWSPMMAGSFSSARTNGVNVRARIGMRMRFMENG